MIKFNKKIFYWSLYDFANSVVMINFLLYFSQWIVVDKLLPEIYYNLTTVFASFLFILSAIFLSQKVDKDKNFIGGIRIMTFLSFVFFSLTFLAILSGLTPIFAIILFTFASIFYLLSFVYFTPLVIYLAKELNKSTVEVSSYGQIGNYLGQVFGLLVTLPFVSGSINFFALGRAEVFLPAIILFILLSLPMLFLFKIDIKKNLITESDFTINFKSFFELIRRNRNLLIFLIVFILISDGLLTFASNFSIYLEKIQGIQDKTKALMTLSILFMSAIGAYLCKYIPNRKYEVKILSYIIMYWIGVFVLFAFVRDFYQLLFLTLMSGLFFGPTWTISRSIIAGLIPENFESRGFTFYVITERIASIFGPLLWGLIILFADSEKLGYTMALLSLSLVFLLSLLIFKKYFRIVV